MTSPSAPATAPTWSDWVAGARPRTLPAAVVPVAVGAGVAAGVGPGFGDGVVWWRVGGALVVSLLLQVGVNYANDYSDGVRGTDDVRVGPMRLVATGTAAASDVKRAAMATFLAAAVVGLVLAAATSWWLVLVGLSAILAAWGYTGGPRPYGYLGLGELFVFVYFGLVATVGTTFLAIERVPAVAWPAATGVGFLACALLVINNLRDIPTDAEVGKQTLAVRLGDRRTRLLYGALVLGAFGAAVICALDRPWCLLAVGAIAFAPPPRPAMRAGGAGAARFPLRGAAARTQRVYGVLLTVGLSIG